MTILKTKWYKIQIPLTLEKAYQAILEQHYKPTNKSGFEIIEYSNDLLRAKFIEKIDVHEIIIDPFGNESLLEAVRYSIFEFSIVLLHKNDYILYIYSPPKSIKYFIKVIYDVLGFGFFIKPILFDLKMFFKTMKELLEPNQIKVTKIIASGLVISETSSAKLEIKSSKHAYNDLFEYFRADNFIIDNIRIALRLNGVDGFIEASKSGLISFSEDYSSEIEFLVKKLTSES